MVRGRDRQATRSQEIFVPLDLTVAPTADPNSQIVSATAVGNGWFDVVVAANASGSDRSTAAAAALWVGTLTDRQGRTCIPASHIYYTEFKVELDATIPSNTKDRVRMGFRPTTAAFTGAYNGGGIDLGSATGPAPVAATQTGDTVGTATATAVGVVVHAGHVGNRWQNALAQAMDVDGLYVSEANRTLSNGGNSDQVVQWWLTIGKAANGAQATLRLRCSVMTFLRRPISQYARGG